MDDQTDICRVADALTATGNDLELELEWLAQCLHSRLSAYFGESSQSPLLPEVASAPDLTYSNSAYANLVHERQLNTEERLILLLALTPLLRPQLLDVLLTRNEATQRTFSEFGGWQLATSPSFRPTVETACFLLAGDSLIRRLSAIQLFEPAQTLLHSGLIELPADGNPATSLFERPLVATARLLDLLRGGSTAYAADASLPLQHVQTQLEWEDLILPESTLDQLDEIQTWLHHGQTLLNDWGMAGKLRAGYTSLFYGPSGTGKTLAASLLGKLCERDVYKIDLSMAVSKYIGDTEKNLAKVFDHAEGNDWILFFDEADALFGKRTNVDSSHDRYANQEVSYLLQRLEEYSGVAILATNLKDNIDQAFLRRFQSIIPFAMPRVPERLRIWRSAISERAVLEDSFDLTAIAEQYELSGGTIMNVVRYASLKALARGDRTIRQKDVADGIRRELIKEGRAF